jgi:hypothetical protein
LYVFPFSGLGLIALLKQLNKEYSTKAINLIKLYATRHSYKSTLGIQAELQEELITLLTTLIPDDEHKKNKVVLIVEDLDRCGDEKVIEIIDALRLLLEEDEISKRLVIITVVDERILKSAVFTKLKSTSYLTDENTESDTGKDIPAKHKLVTEYLDKLFISAIKLGELTGDQRLQFLNQLLTNANIEPGTMENMKIQTNPGMENRATGIEPAPASISEVSNTRSSIQWERPAEMTTPARPSGTLDDANPGAPWQGITQKELGAIRQTVQTWQNLTPRKIYIFYYRYLLCKNLLLEKYMGESIDAWQTEQGMRDLISVIRHFTDQYQPNAVCNEKGKISAAANSQYELIIEATGTVISKGKIDWMNLLEVLEIVIAY